jgi:hypothetical protein
LHDTSEFAKVEETLKSSKWLDAAIQGGDTILHTCLGVEAGEIVALVFDETTIDVAWVVNKAATLSNIVVIPHRVPIEDQIAFSSNNRLPVCLMEDLGAARAVISCLAAETLATPFRSALIGAATGSGKRVGHMPGINVETLAQAMSTDYDVLSAKCQDLALALMIGKMASLFTYKPDGRSVELLLELGGVDRPPITSTGIIPRGTWGNLPGGETFIAPIEGTATGEFVLNGSFTGRIVDPENPLILHFDKGLLMDIEGLDPSRGHLVRMLGESWETRTLELAELGIGVNTGIKSLTGRSLIDEKCAGTIHIAVGDNARYGGKNHSELHEDLVTRGPTLKVDGKTILDRGQYAFVSSDWRINPAEVAISPEFARDHTKLRRSLIRADQNPVGSLRVQRAVVEERLCSYTISDDETNRHLWNVYSRLPQFPGVTTINRLQNHLSADYLSRLLTILSIHKLIELVPGGLD